MGKKLEGKTALVTGASKGIGASIAKHLASEGAYVIVNYSSSKEGAEKTANEIKAAGGKAVTLQANLSKAHEVEHLFEEIKKQTKQLDILVNNAGIYEFAELDKINSEHFHKQFDLNVLGLLLTTKEAVKLFGPKGGSVINISSVAGLHPISEGSVYSATKAAVDAITKSLSLELGSRKIRVNSVNPGMIITEGLVSTGLAEGEFRDTVEKTTPLGRVGRPEDVAKVVSFLASDDAGWVTGETLEIAGGLKQL